jgi:hypothetical protein
MQAGRKIIIVTETPDGSTEQDGVVEKTEGGKIYITDILVPFNEINGEQEGSSDGTRVYIKQVKGVMGNSREAIVNQSLSPIVSKESAIEMLTNLARSITDGKGDVKPFLLACKDGQILAQECTVDEDGIIGLPNIKMNSKRDIEMKSKFVRKIMKDIEPVLRAEIGSVTYVALMRKDSNKLESMMRALKNKKKKTKVKVENRAGCIWLIIEDFEVVL